MPYWLLIIAAMFATPSYAAEFTLADCRREMSKMINLLEQGKDKELLLTYVDPTQLRKFLTDHKIAIDAFAADFKNDGKAARLLKALHAANDTNGTIDTVDKTVRFALDGAGPREITLEFVDGRWFIRN
ncbi:MAG: hypothetical protein U1F68_00525 [Gammaproteobacteria bacterium]